MPSKGARFPPSDSDAQQIDVAWAAAIRSSTGRRRPGVRLRQLQLSARASFLFREIERPGSGPVGRRARSPRFSPAVRLSQGPAFHEVTTITRRDLTEDPGAFVGSVGFE